MKKNSIVVIIVVFIIHQILDFKYRPFIYQSNIFDLYLADSFTNLTSVIGLSALMVLKDSKVFYQEKKSEHLIYIIPTIGMITYEFIQLIIPNRVFSLSDILYSLIGGIVAYLIKRIVYDKHRPKIQE